MMFGWLYFYEKSHKIKSKVPLLVTNYVGMLEYHIGQIEVSVPNIRLLSGEMAINSTSRGL